MKTHRLAFIILFFSVVLVHGPAVTHDFVMLDDSSNVYENPFLHPFDTDGLHRFWAKPYYGFYAPLTYTLWGVQMVAQRFLSGQALDSAEVVSPFVFHAANVALHLACSVLVYLILNLLIVTRPGAGMDASAESRDPAHADMAALAGALLFALHPLQVEVVAWVTGFRDVLSAFLMLTAVWVYLRHRSRGSIDQRLFTLATCFYVAAVLAKPAAVVLPVIMVAFDFFIFEIPWRASLAALFSWFVVVFASVGMTMYAQVEHGTVYFNPSWLRPFVALDALGFYASKIFIPAKLVPLYGRSPEFLFNSGTYLWTAPVVLAVAAALAFFVFRRHLRKMALGLALWLLALSPTLGFISFAGQKISTVCDRYMYFPMLGVSLLCAAGVSRLKGPRAAAAACALVAVLAGGMSARQVSYWKNTRTIFEHTLALHPENAMAHYNLALYFHTHGQLAEAREHYAAAHKYSPDDNDVIKHLKQLDEGRGSTEALKLGSRSEIFLERAKYYSETRRFTQALNELGRAEAVNPGESSIYADRGTVFAMTGRYDEALVQFRKAVELHPSAGVYMNISRALALKGDLRGAEESALKAREMAGQGEQSQ